MTIGHDAKLLRAALWRSLRVSDVSFFREVVLEGGSVGFALVMRPGKE